MYQSIICLFIFLIEEKHGDYIKQITMLLKKMSNIINSNCPNWLKWMTNPHNFQDNQLDYPTIHVMNVTSLGLKICRYIFLDEQYYLQKLVPFQTLTNSHTLRWEITLNKIYFPKQEFDAKLHEQNKLKYLTCFLNSFMNFECEGTPYSKSLLSR